MTQRARNFCLSRAYISLVVYISTTIGKFHGPVLRLSWSHFVSNVAFCAVTTDSARYFIAIGSMSAQWLSLSSMYINSVLKQLDFR